MYANCCGQLLIVFVIQLFVTAALHALILIFFYLLISGLGYPGLVVFHQIKIFLIKNKQQETLHKQQAAGEAQQTHSVEITIKLSCITSLLQGLAHTAQHAIWSVIDLPYVVL